MDTTILPANPTPQKGSSGKKNIPAGDVELEEIAQTILKSWKASPLTLYWLTREAFEEKVQAYSQELNQRLAGGAARPALTATLKSVNAEINATIKHVKSYLAEKYPSNAKSYYTEFGIENVDGSFRIPASRANRKKSLTLLLAAIPKHGFTDKTFGLAHWTKLAADYDKLVGDTKETDATVAGKVSSKNMLGAEIRKVLQSLVYMIKASYPDNWAGVLREWGFQKEKY